MIKDSLTLGGRSIREALRTPDSLVPSIFIPVFFLVVNVGQTARIFPAGETDFLKGQNYAAFQLPASLLLSASFGAAALYLVEEIEGGYFDKLRATPISRMSIVIGRLWAEFVKTGVLAAAMLLISLPFGIRIESGPLGFLLLIVRRDLYSQIIGFLTLENGISAFAVVALGGVPFLMEMGIFAVIASGVVLMAILSGQVHALYATHDTDTLRELTD
jgi:ABC-2 type transport system permease protein